MPDCKHGKGLVTVVLCRRCGVAIWGCGVEHYGSCSDALEPPRHDEHDDGLGGIGAGRTGGHVPALGGRPA